MPVNDRVPAVQLSNASVSFGALEVLSDVSLTIAKGSIAALLGPSGSGKTTLLRLLSGAVHGPGELVIDDPVGLVYQDLKLLPWLTVFDNVLIARDPAVQDEQIAHDLLDRLGIADKSRSFPYQLSGGQKQRVALARALYGGAKLLLMDEPFSALDFLSRRRLVELVRGIAGDQQLTVLCVTHDVNDAMELANRLLVMRDGKIVGDFIPESRDELGKAHTKAYIMALFEGD